MEQGLSKQNRQQVVDAILSAQGLRGRQSVRATFRLSQRTIDLLKIVAGQLGLKQKSLFDQLVEDADVLTAVAKQIKARREMLSAKRRQKTFVLSRKSLDLLDSISREREVPRDLLVEVSIRRLLPLLEAERRKYRQRLRLGEQCTALFSEVKLLHHQAIQQLGEEDCLTDLLAGMVSAAEVCSDGLSRLLRDGRGIDEYHGAQKREAR